MPEVAAEMAKPQGPLIRELQTPAEVVAEEAMKDTQVIQAETVVKELLF